MIRESERIHAENIEMNKKMAEIGSRIVLEAATVLTHYWLQEAMAQALGVTKKAYKLGKIKQIYEDETRPRLQGGR